jgi:hypothetical protein
MKYTGKDACNCWVEMHSGITRSCVYVLCSQDDAQVPVLQERDDSYCYDEQSGQGLLCACTSSVLSERFRG